MESIPIPQVNESYQHFKGAVYRIVAVGKANLDFFEDYRSVVFEMQGGADFENTYVCCDIPRGSECVVYTNKNHTFYVRTLQNFSEMITRPRFKKVEGDR